MDNATETIVPTIAPEEDVEAQITKITTEKENYRLAYLKEVDKNKDLSNETEDEKIRRVVREEQANSTLAQFDKEKEALLQKALKENKELKLAQMNKTGAPPASIGSHSEGEPVRDTLVSADQMAAFKAKGWSDKDIERYKKNLQRNQR